MRLRYRCESPSSVWYENVQLALPRDVEMAKQTLVNQCKHFFGSQFYRFDKITVSLVRGTRSIVDIPVQPNQDPSDNEVSEDLDLSNSIAA